MGHRICGPPAKDDPLNNSNRFTLLMVQVAGKRLTYAQLTGKEVDWLHDSAAGTGLSVISCQLPVKQQQVLLYQTLQALGLTIGWPCLHPNACQNSGIFDSTLFTRN